jgi:hypothetical protein
MSKSPTVPASRAAHDAATAAQRELQRIDDTIARLHAAPVPDPGPLQVARERAEAVGAANLLGDATDAEVADAHAALAAVQADFDAATRLAERANISLAGLQRRREDADAEVAAARDAVQRATIDHLSEVWRAADAQALDLGRKYAAAVARILAAKRELLNRGGPCWPAGLRDLPDLPVTGPATEAAARDRNPSAPHGWNDTFVPRSALEVASSALAAELDELAKPAARLSGRT